MTCLTWGNTARPKISHHENPGRLLGQEHLFSLIKCLKIQTSFWNILRLKRHQLNQVSLFAAGRDAPASWLFYRGGEKRHFGENLILPGVKRLFPPSASTAKRSLWAEATHSK